MKEPITEAEAIQALAESVYDLGNFIFLAVFAYVAVKIASAFINKG